MTCRILALTKYGPDAASTRQRLIQYGPALEKAGFSLDIRPFFEQGYMHRLSEGSSPSVVTTAAAYLRRFHDLWSARRADILWVYAELFPYLPSWFEGAAVRSGTPVIYDLDDAFFHAHERHSFLRDKLRPLIANAAAVSAGNEYLAEYARRWNDNVYVVPTVVDTGAYVPAPRTDQAVPVIGWIGSPSTWPYVRPLLPVLASACAGGKARFLVIGAGKAAENDRFNGMELRDWSESTEISDVQTMDIGIMPLPDEPWARGKCGYKLIQYMACGLPVVASPVGVNVTLVNDGKSGLLATDADHWRIALASLMHDPGLRSAMGVAGRAHVVADYSLQTHSRRLVEIMNAVSCLMSKQFGES